MARRPTISDERILQAAREAFLELGVSASTADVAKRAGISEGTIFKRFPTRAELVKAAMQVDLDDPDFIRTLIAATEDLDPRQVLFTVGKEAVEFFRRLMPVAMLQFGTGKKGGIPEHLKGTNAPPVRALKALAAFFERHIKSGRMRKHKPEVAARMFLGSIQSYVFFEIVLRRAETPVEHYLEGITDVLWKGVAPRDKGI